MGIREPFVSEIAPDTYAINEFGLAAMYLAVERLIPAHKDWNDDLTAEEPSYAQVMQ